MELSTTKRRRLSQFKFGRGIFRSLWYLQPGSFFELDNQDHTYVANEIQETESQENPFYLTLYRFHPERRAKDIKEFVDVGGPFRTSRSYVSDPKGKPIKGPLRTYRIVKDQLGSNGTGFDSVYTGPILPVDPAPGHFPSNAFTSDSEMAQLGTTAIALCKPTTPTASLAAALGELRRDGLPHIPMLHSLRERTRLAKKAGDEYLNVQFGWVPLISDVRKIAYAIKHSDRILKQYERNVGKGVRRRFVFPTITIEEDFVPGTAGSPYPVGPPLSCFDDYNGELTGHRTTVTETWFSGSFTYWIPTAYDSRLNILKQAALANKLFGITPTPEVLWQLSPWSWAVDWFTDIGDVLSNVSDWAAQGLVMQYGYLMQTKRITDTYTLSGIKPKGYDAMTTSLSFTSITKQRVKADPFGFGVSWDDLSPYQLSIAAALGLSRGR